MYIAIRIILLVCLYTHECHMPITPYFFYAQKDLAQRLTNSLYLNRKHPHLCRTRQEDTELNWEDTIFAI